MTNDHATKPPTAGSITAGKPDARAIIDALTRILEHAARFYAGGSDPDLAILRALSKYRASLALECVARAAWALVVRANEASLTKPDASDAHE